MLTQLPRRATATFAAMLAIAAVFMLKPQQGSATVPSHPLAKSPIKHVVLIYQENHSFNELLGALCMAQGNRCLATDQGEIHNGKKVPLADEPDIVPEAGHTRRDQVIIMNGGKMNGWDLQPGGGGQIGGEGCPKQDGYPCMMQAQAGASPTVWSLADTYALSDMTFETGPVPSWGSHLDLVSATLDGFLGEQPVGSGEFSGTGCDSHKDSAWQANVKDPTTIMVPACIPDQAGNGPYRPSPVEYVPTIMTRLDAAGIPWKIYAPGPHGGGYGWAICPTFYECMGSDQVKNTENPRKLAHDAKKGRLAKFSILIPYYNDSQHNSYSLIKGDNWIAENVSAIMNGPDWDSTAIFITYDDCGCFYDPVRPPAGFGVRVPMIIVSPYAKPHFVDHTTASFLSLLAFTEHLYGLPPLTEADAAAYDYSDAFDFSQKPLSPIDLPQHKVPQSSIDYIAKHPPPKDDPT